jgi:hypothetical protein
LEGSFPFALHQSLNAVHVNLALLSLSFELLHNLGSLEVKGSSLIFWNQLVCASCEDSVGFLDDLAFVSVSHETLYNLGFVVPANSLFKLTQLPVSASLGALSESSNDSSSGEWSYPLAFSELVVSSLIGDALLTLSVEVSDDLGSSESELNNWFDFSNTMGSSSVSLLVDSAMLSVLVELSQNSLFLVPAYSLAQNSLFVNGALVWTLVEGSLWLSTSHGSSPSALDEFVLSIDKGDTFLSLSGPFLEFSCSFEVEWSPFEGVWTNFLWVGASLPFSVGLSVDDTFLSGGSILVSFDHSCLNVPAHISGLATLSPNSASFSSFVDVFLDLSSLPESRPCAFCELVVSILMSNTVLSLSDESHNLRTLEFELSGWSILPWGETSDPLSSWRSVKLAGLLSLFISLGNSGLVAPADGLFLFSSCPGSASFVIFIELFNNSGTFPVTLPMASGPSVFTSFVSGASLTLSVPSLHNLTFENGWVASDPLLASLIPKSTASSIFKESSDNSSLLAPANSSFVGS